MSKRIIFEQDITVPVIAYSVENEKRGRYEQVFGTGFFIDNKGTFLTCRHVIESLNKYLKANPDYKAGLGVKPYDLPMDELIKGFEISEVEYAENNDVAIGYAKYKTHASILPPSEPAMPLLEIIAMGYPDTALVKKDDFMWVNLRVLKGIVQRNIRSNEIDFFSPHTEALELSFQVPACMSGAALVKRVDKRYREIIGICIGAYQTEQTVSMIEEIEENGKIFRERRVCIERFGFALDIKGILGWKPKGLQKTLKEVFEETKESRLK